MKAQKQTKKNVATLHNGVQGAKKTGAKTTGTKTTGAKTTGAGTAGANTTGTNTTGTNTTGTNTTGTRASEDGGRGRALVIVVIVGGGLVGGGGLVVVAAIGEQGGGRGIGRGRRGGENSGLRFTPKMPPSSELARRNGRAGAHLRRWGGPSIDASRARRTDEMGRTPSFILRTTRSSQACTRIAGSGGPGGAGRTTYRGRVVEGMALRAIVEKKRKKKKR